jgi:hypothetical protein
MGVFKSERRFWTEATSLAEVAEHVAAHFRGKGYEVVVKETGAGAWDIDITRVGVFRTVSGLRTALKVRLEPEPGLVMARAGVGILGQQALPTAISMLIFWPVILTQVWGIVRAAKIDNEALAVVEAALAKPAAPSPAAGPATGSTSGFCPHCGSAHGGGGRFCTGCGSLLAPA